MYLWFRIINFLTVSYLECQQSTNSNDALQLQKRIEDLELQLSRITEHSKQCNSTIHPYDDQELHTQQEELRVMQNAIKLKLNNTIIALSIQSQQISLLRQEAVENFTQSRAKSNELEEIVANVSEHVGHLYEMRDDHSDQLSQINSNISSIFTQLMHFNGSVNNLASGLETQSAEIASLSDSLSTLDLHVDEIDRRDTTKDTQLEHEISQNEEHINSIRSECPTK